VVVHVRIRGSSNAYAHRVRAPPHVFVFVFCFWHRTIVEWAVFARLGYVSRPHRDVCERVRAPTDGGRGRRTSTRVDARGGRDDDDGGDDDDDASRVRRREARDAREGERLARVVVRARERVAGDARGDDAGDASGERTRGRARERER